jgi:hypothetical protein
MMSNIDVAVLANLQQDSHFNLERRPALAATLDALNLRSSWHCIYALKDDARRFSIRCAAQKLASDLKGVRFILAHKECLEFLPLEFFSSVPGKTLMGFLGDEEWQMNFIANYLPMFDATTVYTTAAVANYKGYGHQVLHLPLGATFPEPSLAQFVPDIDVLFVGRPYGHRAAMINTLVGVGISVTVYGSQEWRKLVPPQTYKGHLPNELYEATVARAKIVLGFMEAPDGGPVHINAKIFDAAKVGRFCLLTYYEPIYSDYNLMEGESIVTYKDVDDLCAKVRHYLDHPEERERIAGRSANLLRASSDYRALYRRLLERFLVLDARQEFGAPSRATGWSLLRADATLADTHVIESICAINADTSMIVLNTEGRNRVIVKRLPFVDAGSVLLGPNVPSPWSFGGLVWAPRARRLPHFPLNRYDRRPPLLVRGLLALETLLAFALEIFRTRVRKFRPV